MRAFTPRCRRLVAVVDVPMNVVVCRECWTRVNFVALESSGPSSNRRFFSREALDERFAKRTVRALTRAAA